MKLSAYETESLPARELKWLGWYVSPDADEDALLIPRAAPASQHTAVAETENLDNSPTISCGLAAQRTPGGGQLCVTAEAEH